MPTKVVAVANQKGGVGKTTTVINLAACVAELEETVLVVDLDPQANATSGLGLPKAEGGSLYNALLGEGHVANLVKPTPVRNVDMIPSEIDLTGCEIDVARMERYLHRFGDVLNPLVEANIYSYVIIDCPPSLGVLTMNALTAANSMIVPMQCEYYALEGLSVISGLVDRLRSIGANPAMQIEGILMTMFDGRTSLSAEVVAEVRQHFGDKVYKTVIPRNVRLSEAPSYGQPIIEYDNHSSGAKAYRDFAREFVRRSKPEAKHRHPPERPHEQPPAQANSTSPVPAADPVPAPAPATNVSQ